MPEYLSPGVYIEEVDRGVKPIQGVGTSTAAFVGITEKAQELNKPELVTSWNQYVEHFGGFVRDAYLPLSVYGYFANGGVRCYVISIQTVGQSIAATAQLTASTRKSDRKPLELRARIAGTDGNDITVEVKSEQVNGNPSSSESNQQSSSASSGGGSSSRRGSSSSSEDAPSAEDSSEGPAGDPASSATPSSGESSSGGSKQSSSSSTSSTSSSSSSRRSSATSSASSESRSGPSNSRNENSMETFVLLVREKGKLRERYPNLTVNKDDERYIGHVVNTQSQLIEVVQIEENQWFAEPQVGEYRLAGGKFEPVKKPVTVPAVEGTGNGRGGIAALEALDEVTILCVPDLMSAYKKNQIDNEGLIAAQMAMLEHCRRMRYRFAILDAPPDLTPTEVKEWRQNTAGYSSAYGALYYPWIKVADPARGGQMIEVPPSGHVAGIYARSDTERGVHKAPANEVVAGAVDLTRNVTKGEQDILNPISVNCIRKFPGRGIRVWGARTLVDDPSWRYINVRRLFNYVEASIEAGTQWVVFEPNDPTLWAKVRRDVSSFLRTVWLSGALFGNTPEEAYYVRCDSSLNTDDVRNAGQLIVEVGLAPVKPAEFVIFRISQWAGPNAEA